MYLRNDTKKVKIGSVTIGGGSPIAVQSMTTTDTKDIKATVAQIRRLEEAGCEIVRVAVPDEQAVRALRDIRGEISIPLVADIHFNYRFALMAIEAGVDKLRLNPGNIGAENRVAEVVSAAKERKVPIRIGVNSGSLEKRLIERYGGPTPEALVESALGHVAILERLGFYDIVVSLKGSDVPLTIEAYRIFAESSNYPLHVGVTESGTIRSGTIKSSVGIGTILAMGIGDTIRVSLTADPVEEIRVGFEILKSLHLRQRGPTVISCPSCGRAQVDVIALAEKIETRLQTVSKPFTVAVMGCAVNGPGESVEADFGIAAGNASGLIYVNGKPVRKVKEEELVNELMLEINRSLGETPSPTGRGSG